MEIEIGQYWQYTEASGETTVYEIDEIDHYTEVVTDIVVYTDNKNLKIGSSHQDLRVKEYTKEMKLCNGYNTPLWRALNE